MKHVLFILTCVAAFCAACSNENNDDGLKELELLKGTQQEQILYADENGKDNGIRFTAASDWTATVTEEAAVRSEAVAQVEWLTLNKYSGGAGEHMLQMTIRDNLTGKARKAKITIRCGGTEIVITVEQKAVKEDGTVVKPVRKISLRETIHSDAVNGYSSTRGDYEKTFDYDTEGRLGRIVTKYEESEEGTVTHSFDYRMVGEIGITCYRSGYKQTDTYQAKLNANGNVVELEEWEAGEFLTNLRFSYTEEGRLARIEDEESVSNLFYEDGLLVKSDYRSEYWDESGSVEFPIATCYPNRIPNSGSFDAFALLMEDDDYDFLYYMGRLGKTSDCMLEIWGAHDEAMAVGPDMGYLEPNEIIHQKATYVEWSEDGMMRCSYKFDDDKHLVELTATEPFAVMEAEWDIVVGSELVSPKEPWKGYKYTIKNRTEKKVRDDRDVYTYTIIY